MEPGLRGERVIEEGGEGPPEVEAAEDRLPGKDQPVRVEQSEAAEQGEEDGAAEPVSGEHWQALEPVLQVVAGRHGGGAFLFPSAWNGGGKQKDNFDEV